MRRLIRRFHEWMLYHCQWWFFTRGDMSRHCMRESRRTAALQHRSAMAAKLSMARQEQARWAKQVAFWQDEWNEADSDVRFLAEESSDA